VGAIFLSVFTGIDRGASQLMPDAFGATGMMLVCYLMVRYQEASPARSLRWLIGCGLAFVWAYEIKESNMLLLPGCAAAVWLCRGRLRDGLIFCGILFAAIAVETLCFRLFTNYSSRFAIVSEAHGDIPYITFWQLFDRYTRLEPAWQMLIWMWVPSALWLASSRDRRQQALALVPAAFLFFLTFTVRSINPTMVWVRFYSRYIEPATALLVIGVALFVVEAARRAWASHAPARVVDLPQRFDRLALPLVALVCGLVGFVEYKTSQGYLPHHPFRETPRISAILNDAYRRNLPIVMTRNRKREEEDRKIRPLKLAYGVYLNDSALLEQDVAQTKKGWLPDMLEGIRHGKRYSYVLRDAEVYAKGQMDEWVERGCAVVLTEAKNQPGAARGVPSLVMKLSEKLPATCRPPTAER
jgi:Dolichyl-phosphate-mannose-protein mannosyltransferase